MNQSCLCTTVRGGRIFNALTQQECIASYSADVTVKSSGSVIRKATVTSASLLRMHPFSTERIGNLLSNVAVFSMLRIAESKN